MARNKKPRTKRRTLAHGISKVPICFRFSSDNERTLQIVPHAELAKMLTGAGNAESWGIVAGRLDIGLVLAQLYGDIERLTMVESLAAIGCVKERFGRVGKYGLSAVESTLIGAGLVLTDCLQLSSTRRECRDAIETVIREGVQ